MKKFRQRLLFFLIALLVAFIGLVQTFNTLAGRHREQVQLELQRFLGKDVGFDKLEVSTFGGLGFAAKEFRLADDSRFAATPVIRAKELILGVSLWNLLFGKVVINSLTFEELEFQIITDEAGLLNLTALAGRKKQLGTLPKLKSPAPERKHPAVSFLITKIQIRNGRVEYIDRSIKEPAEMQVRNVEMEARGLDPTGTTRIRFAAALPEGLGHDVRIDGQLKPGPPELPWSHCGIDLAIQFDSLHVPVIARAIAALRDKIPRELDVTGPLAVQARLTGTLGRPRIDDIILKVPLFGSSDYNAILKGSVALSERRSWEEAQIQGRLTVDPVDLARYRNLRVLKQFLPAALVTEGTVGIFSSFEGTWENLRLGLLVRGDKGVFRFRNWLHKPVNSPAEVRARITWHKRGVVFHESELNLGAARMKFSGVIEDTPVPRLQLKLRGERSPVAPWGNIFSPSAFYAMAGEANWDLAIDNNLASADENWNVQGTLSFTETEFKHKDSGRKIENLNAQISFLGKQARLDRAIFRLGSSQIAIAAHAANLLEARVSYRLSSPNLNLSDLPALWVNQPVRLKNVSASGEIDLPDGGARLTASVSAAAGSLQQLGFRDLRADVTWSGKGMAFKDLSLRTLNGTFHADGYWASGSEQSQRIEIVSRLEAADMRALLDQIIPQFGDRLDGQLNAQAQFKATAKAGMTLQEALNGSGEVRIQSGVIKNVNLVTQLLLRGSGSSVSVKTLSRLPAGLAVLAKRRDTPFDSLKANFVLEQQRLRTENLVFSTLDYTITGAGSISHDRTTNWNGLLVLSPRLTQEILRDNKMIRYLMDRRGRLSVSFRVEGTLPNVRIRLDNRALAQAFRGGSAQRGDEGAGGAAKPGQGAKESKGWIPDALERLLNR